jgi:hypothetical protein
VVALARADQPLLFAAPTAVSLGLLARGDDKSASLNLSDAGGGSGTWQIARVVRGAPAGVRLVLPATVDVPGALPVTATVSRAAKPGDLDAYIELRRGSEVRRVPLWGRVTAGALARHRLLELARPGVTRSTTSGQPSLVSRYRYPETPTGVGVTTVLRGPERVFRVRLTKRVANFGVVITQRGRASRVEPRVVSGVDENRLTGYAGLPVNHNPYMDEFRDGVLAAGALSPAPGEYAVVFDSPARAGAGSFTFRYWVDDVTPPMLRLRTRVVAAGRDLKVAAIDAGAGIYADTIRASIDGESYGTDFRPGVISVSTAALSPGTHRLRLRVSDYQEAKNTENVARILPNTRTLVVTFRVR